MKTCIRCVLPETFPGISFDEAGLCIYCRQAGEKEDILRDKTEYLGKFKEVIAAHQGKSDYDCTLAFSGGKDSTYTLYVLREVFGLNVLALTFDNGFISDQAFANIRTVTEKLGADSIVFKADFNVMKKIFKAGAGQAMYSAKTLERASTICTSCIGLAKFIFLKTALEKRIPIMAWGWTPGQAPIRSSVMKVNPVLFKATQEVLRKPMHAVAGEAINRYFISDARFADTCAFPYNVSPLAFMEYNEEAIVAQIKKLGWRSPRELDANSTNCLLNSFANRIHIAAYGFHPYAFEIAGMVRTGILSREEGLKKLEESENQDTVKSVKEKLGLVLE